MSDATILHSGKKSMTMKVHELQHIPLFVNLFGPPWAFSCFPYESETAMSRALYMAPDTLRHRLVSLTLSMTSGYCRVNYSLSVSVMCLLLGPN